MTPTPSPTPSLPPPTPTPPPFYWGDVIFGISMAVLVAAMLGLIMLYASR